ncbi:polysaccharide deacetylase [Bacterioplanes sanyensis]|nr:polysaccharide deacetylase [Bacterioplanes sanyensis]
MTMPSVSILMYHQVGEFSDVKRLKANYCHVRHFAAHMAFLRMARYQVVSLDTAVKALKGEVELSGHAVAITFDDGYENFYQYAYPILQRYQLPATVYAVAGLLGQSSDWLYEDKLTPAPLMSVERMREVQHNGLIEFGSHAITHPRLTQISTAAMQDEVVRSKQLLEDALQRPVDHICYPYGDHNEAVVDAARAAGYASGTTIVKGIATAAHDPLALPRKAMSFNEGRYRLWRNLHFKNGDLAKNIVLQPCQESA